MHQRNSGKPVVSVQAVRRQGRCLSRDASGTCAARRACSEPSSRTFRLLTRSETPEIRACTQMHPGNESVSTACWAAARCLRRAARTPRPRAFTDYPRTLAPSLCRCGRFGRQSSSLSRVCGDWSAHLRARASLRSSPCPPSLLLAFAPHSPPAAVMKRKARDPDKSPTACTPCRLRRRACDAPADPASPRWPCARCAKLRIEYGLPCYQPQPRALLTSHSV